MTPIRVNVAAERLAGSAPTPIMASIQCSPPPAARGSMNNATPTKSVTRWLGNGWLRAGLLALVLCAVYGGPAWQADYVHDDNPAVLENGHVRWPPPLQEIFSSPYFGTQRGFLTQGLIRPLVTLSFAAEIPLGLDTARRRHLVQLALYWLVCLLVASLAGRIARSLECDPRRATYFAWAAALLFAVHPVHAEVVMAIAYRPDLLALLMLLPATTALLDLAEDRPAGKLELFSIPLLFGLSLLCKESAMAILGPWLLWALFRRRRHKRALVVVTACLAVALLYIAWRSRALGGLLVAHIPVNDNPLAHVPVGERLTGACALIWHALCQMLWPSTIAPDYTFDALPVVAMTGWRTLGGGLVLVALCPMRLLSSSARAEVNSIQSVRTQVWTDLQIALIT